MAVTTTLESKYVVLARLYTFLNAQFPGQYSVKIDGDFVEISAPRLLTQAEIDSVTDTE
jgi:hypothetical protein